MERGEDAEVRRAAAVIRAAEALLITAGAGMGVDSSLAHKVMRLFASESVKALAEIARAAAAADAQALSRTAHSLKSSAASVGAGAIAAIATEVEAMARAGQAVAPHDHPARLRSAFERFCADPAIRVMVTPEALERNAA